MSVATAHGMAYLRETLTALAIQAGAVNPHVEITTGDSIAAADGQAIFVGRTLHGHVTGNPVAIGA